MTGDAPQVRGKLTAVYTELASPVEGELRREPIADADAPCPRCDGREWLLVERRAEPQYPFTRWRALVCASCGAAGGWESAGRARPGRAAEMRGERGQEPTVEDLCRLASFRVVAPSASPILRGYSHANDRLTGVTLASGHVEVTTEIRVSALYAVPTESEPKAEQRARDELEGLLLDGQALPRKRSEPARSLDDAEADRQAKARAAAAMAREVLIELDGEPIPFACVLEGACWAAAAHIDDRTITVASRKLPAGAVTLQTRRRG